VNISTGKSKGSLWIAAISALVFSLLQPLPASATVSTSFTSTPSTSTALSLDASVDLQTTLGLPTNATLDASMQQVWPDGQGLLGTVTAPTGWALEYRVGQNWLSSIPADRLSVSGVRANATALQTGPGTANGTQTIASRTSSLIVADASSISASGRGDGWDVFLTPQYILNVYHHDSNYRLECHFRATGNLCSPSAVYQINGYATANASSGTYYRGKVYSAVTHSGNAEIICTNVASLPFTSCGSTVVGSGSISAQAHLGTQVFDGQRIWVGSGVAGNMLCFDVTTGAACTAYVLPGYVSSAASIKSFATFIDGKIFVAANKIFCFDPTTSTACSGAWPVAVNSASLQANVIPKRTTAGVVNGVCTITNDVICFDLAGASVAMPAALHTMLTSNATEVHGGVSYFQTTAWTNTRQYWASNPSGLDWDTGRAQCYDWVTNAACAGFSTGVDIGDQRYAFTIDASNTACVWTNGNDGTISNFDGNTGAAGCPVTTTKAGIDFAALPRYSCNVNTQTIRTFQQLQVVMPNTSSFNTANLKVSVLDGSGAPVSGFQNLAVVGGYADLTGLQVSTTTTEFSFIVESVNATSFALSSQDAAAITGNLIYEADPVQLCVQISSIMPICPAVLDADTIAQPDLATTGTASYTVQGSPTVSVSDTKTYHVDTITKAQCYYWKTFLNTVGGDGVNAGGLPGLVDSIVFGPDHKMYVGGVFTNAGSNDAADNLAVWDGTTWAPVGQADPAGVPSINGRVNSIAFTSDGNLLVGGAFTNAGSVDAADYFAIYSLTTNTWSAAATAPSSAVNTIAVGADGIAFLGGNFTGKVTAVNIATGATVAMPALGAEVLKLGLSPEGTVYAGGLFTGKLMKYDSATNAWVNVSADANQGNFLSGAVTDFSFNDGKIYVVGLFNGVAVLDLSADTWSWLGGAANPAGNARAIAIDDSGNVYVGGYFTAANTVDAIDVAMWDGVVWHGFRDSRTLSMAMDTSGHIGSWQGVWDVALSANQVAIWGGDMVNCAARSDLDLLCYFGDKILVSPTSLARKATPYVYNGPQVVWQSTYLENVAGGSKLLLKGRLLAKTSKITIGGKEAQILSVSNGEVELVMPANAVGPQPMVLTFSDGSFTFEGYVKYSSASLSGSPVKVPPVTGARPPVTVTISGFADGSPVLTKAMQTKINAFLKAHADYKTISCVGYTEGPTVLKSDYALSRNRAKNSCGFAKAGVAKKMVLVPLKQGQGLVEGASKRRVVITLTD
jgi:hypothetical protein